MEKRNILVAPLNWGLGHATRCIPIIQKLQSEGFVPILASDGDALLLLKKEFANLKSIELPSYNITYSKKANHFKTKLLRDSPHILRTIKEEKQIVAKLVQQEGLKGIISDNRFGVRHESLPSVFISHQLRVKSGSTTWLSTKLHQRIIAKFDECWIPDKEGKPNLSGNLGHLNSSHLKLRYIGPLSRFIPKPISPKYELLVLLSGPEPQRSMLGEKLLVELKEYSGKVLFVKGKIENQQKIEQRGNISIYNFMTTQELENTINASKIVLCRSGYTSIMDLAKLKKKAFFIPTPGQFEQEYLAKKFMDEGLVPFQSQKNFCIDDIKSSTEYKGFQELDFETNCDDLFHLFEGKGELASHT